MLFNLRPGRLSVIGHVSSWLGLGGTGMFLWRVHRCDDRMFVMAVYITLCI